MGRSQRNKDKRELIKQRRNELKDKRNGGDNRPNPKNLTPIPSLMGGKGSTHPPVKKANTGWKVKGGCKDEPEVTACSLVGTPTLYIEPIPRRQIELLMDAYPRCEWFGYLIGERSGTGFFVEGIVIPPHKTATAGSAEAEPFNTPENCIGVIHSHNIMGAFHSGTDQAHVDKNYPVSTTVAKRTNALEYDTVCNIKTQCGKMMSLKCGTKYVAQPPVFDEEAFVKKSKENIDKGKTKYAGVVVYGGDDDDWYNGGYLYGGSYNQHLVDKLKKEKEAELDEAEAGFLKDGTQFIDEDGKPLSQKEIDEIMKHQVI